MMIIGFGKSGRITCSKDTGTSVREYQSVSDLGRFQSARRVQGGNSEKEEQSDCVKFERFPEVVFKDPFESGDHEEEQLTSENESEPLPDDFDPPPPLIFLGRVMMIQITEMSRQPEWWSGRWQLFTSMRTFPKGTKVRRPGSS
jgi:hypothetical protein